MTSCSQTSTFDGPDPGEPSFKWKWIISMKPKKSHSDPVSMPASFYQAPVHKYLRDHHFPISIWLTRFIWLPCYHMYVAALTISGKYSWRVWGQGWRKGQHERVRWRKEVGRRRSPFQTHFRSRGFWEEAQGRDRAGWRKLLMSVWKSAEIFTVGSREQNQL